ncbi:PREDICTED: serine/threonine-protein kinase AtPK2/AtPK19-like [Nicotiana attenuata]|uniref:serine/threonine-protein kinase AtPK2/AtPK19-like n=1 Tax=Nicotiana attenuata TaxID=49451 RepID=UPI000905924C|nr:PREDICTED: serine/threonine-protein kinase AtPK2/AtPK19-like [Nicotiana attenuata]
MKVVGQGAFGKVYQVNRKGTSEIDAIKIMRNDKIMEKNYAEYMKDERDILTKIDHPFVFQLRYSFQTKYRLYLGFDFINGGQLFFQLYHQGLFRADLARIYAAEIIPVVPHLPANVINAQGSQIEKFLPDVDELTGIPDPPSRDSLGVPPLPELATPERVFSMVAVLFGGGVGGIVVDLLGELSRKCRENFEVKGLGWHSLVDSAGSAGLAGFVGFVGCCR